MIEADSKASNALLWYFLRRQLSLRRTGSPTVEMLNMLAIEELRRGRFRPTSSGSRSLKSLVATGVGALHGRGPQMRPRVKNGFMMDAQDGRGEICILFLWKRVRVGGLWKRCASSPAGSGNGGPRSCRVGGCKSGCVTPAPCRCRCSTVLSCGQAGRRRLQCEGRSPLTRLRRGRRGCCVGWACARQLDRRRLSTAVTLRDWAAGRWQQRQRSARGVWLLLARSRGIVGMVQQNGMHGARVIQQKQQGIGRHWHYCFSAAAVRLYAFATRPSTGPCGRLGWIH